MEQIRLAYMMFFKFAMTISHVTFLETNNFMKKSELINKVCALCDSRKHSIFNNLDDEQLSYLNASKSCASYKKGQLIFSEGGLPLGLFCVNSGKVKLSATGFDGKEQILRFVKDGDIMGYRALISNERYHSSAIAIEDCQICIIDKNRLNQLLKDNPQLLFKLIIKISDDLKQAEEQIVSLSQKNVRERMAEALLFFKATYGYEADNATINVILSREEIADYVGTTTESAIRLLSEFNSDKIVELSGKKIKILNLQRLIKTANIFD
jgi:CRP-like cAMP-binding protein